jgi:hypothetical protein
MRVLALLVFVSVGCTSSEGSVSGEAPGGAFDVADMISATVTLSDGAGDTSSSARVVLASTSNLCSDISASPAIARKHQRFVTIELRDVSGAAKTAPTAPAIYTIYPNTGTEPPKSASLTVGGLDGTCQLLDEESGLAQSGTVTLISVTGGVFAGSYDVILNTGGHITGSFAPTACPQLATVANAEQHRCM